jgi:hypothetical protein
MMLMTPHAIILHPSINVLCYILGMMDIHPPERVWRIGVLIISYLRPVPRPITSIQCYHPVLATLTIITVS